MRDDDAEEKKSSVISVAQTSADGIYRKQQGELNSARLQSHWTAKAVGGFALTLRRTRD